MSYILEALRKADAERERGAVPDIYTQPLFATDREEAPARPRWVVPVLAASVVLLLGALAFVLLRGGSDAVVVAGAPQTPPGSAASAPGNAAPGNTAPESAASRSAASRSAAPAGAAPAGAAPAGAASAGAAPPGGAPGTTAAPPAPRPAAPPTLAPAAATGSGATPGGGPASAQPPRKTVAETTPPEPTRKPSPAAGSPAAPGGVAAAAPRSDARGPLAAAGASGAAPATPATAPAAAERVHALNELPDDVRRAVPNFTFGGAVYSDNAANRMLIINGQLFNEGGQPSAGVVLDQIRLKSAVFRYRGYRYEIPY